MTTKKVATLGAAPLRIHGEDHSRDEQKADAERRGQPLHPASAAGANEHQLHDSPAAADAEQAVVDAKQEGGPAVRAPGPMCIDKAEGCPPFVEAMIF